MIENISRNLEFQVLKSVDSPTNILSIIHDTILYYYSQYVIGHKRVWNIPNSTVIITSDVGGNNEIGGSLFK